MIFMQNIPKTRSYRNSTNTFPTDQAKDRRPHEKKIESLILFLKVKGNLPNPQPYGYRYRDHRNPPQHHRNHRCNSSMNSRSSTLLSSTHHRPIRTEFSFLPMVHCPPGDHQHRDSRRRLRFAYPRYQKILRIKTREHRMHHGNDRRNFHRTFRTNPRTLFRSTRR